MKYGNSKFIYCHSTSKKYGDLQLDFLIRRKLAFANIDVLRLANAAMRMCQFARSKTQIASEGNPGERGEISLPELTLAIRCWQRQMALHIAHTKWDAAVNGPRPLHQHRLPSAPRQPEPSQLPIEDWTCHLVLGDERCRGEVDTATARLWVRHKLPKKGHRGVAALVCAAVKRAAEAGVVCLLGPPAHSGGCPAFRFRKNTWPQIQAGALSRDFLASIRLDEGSFQEETEPPPRASFVSALIG